MRDGLHGRELLRSNLATREIYRHVSLLLLLLLLLKHLLLSHAVLHSNLLLDHWIDCKAVSNGFLS